MNEDRWILHRGATCPNQIMKKVLLNIVLFVAFATFLIAGCSNDNPCDSVMPGTVVTNRESVAWCDLPPSAPLVNIGGRVLTKAGLLNSVSNEYYALVARGSNRKTISEKFESKRRDLAALHVTRFLQQNAFLLRADELGITAPEKKVAGQWEAVSNVAKKSSMDIEKFCLANGHRSVADMDRFIRDNIRMAEVFRVTFSNRLEVTEKEADELHARLVKGNQDSALTNAIYRARFEKFQKELIDKKIEFGENDEENQKKVPDWVKVEWFVKAPGNAFDEEETVVGKVRYHRLNTWTEVLEGESDFSIYYMREIEQKTSDAPTLFTGFRVYCEKDHGYLVPDKKKLREDMRKRRNVAVVTPEFERLMQHYGVVYPYGLIWRDIFTNKKLPNEVEK